MYHNLIYNEFKETIKIMQIFSCEKDNIKIIESSAKLIANTFRTGGKILSCGNGGSHCNAMHFSEELTGRYRSNRSGYAAITISDPSYLSCVSNDFGYEYVFSRYIESIGNEKDVLFAISTSGKSTNILYAIEAAYKQSMKIIFLTGEKKEKKLSDYIDMEICVPYASYPDHIQEIHIKIIHVLIFLIEKEMGSIS
ncbi:D-sedoheptulose 7-phosphate isomerase [Blochmannia endosymbiont of Camponotus sp. C-003]|uniref:D-sedoheptulose 7-phosphate isomerase n=1 Tax=unclassified Candidatus Blochmanniella TaxID=711328 RepID=UPI0020251112|nr:MULTISPECIES: D-sedoheptulose 7-phosphate isomerase [unclassified Candidatus Blochmannia]URJ23579.1 D-sedoheptulose 7-phosphate isomerase [Blochmannia endosymbiont of Camponotus sp. C-003]URJ28495.1 D-sedoheptulose 7-phosphate isomerase [Blochmannia endosymbiont of Camponotus sp. C-046]